MIAASGGGAAEFELALSYAPVDARAPLTTLFALDRSLGQLLRGIGEPTLARIRLAWWREQLAVEASGPDPLLAQIAHNLTPKGVGGAALAALVDGWEVLTDAELPPPALEDYARDRGERLFMLGGAVIGGADSRLESAGKAWALVDLARNSSDQMLADRALRLARAQATGGHWPARLRTFGALAMLARRDARKGLPLDAQGSPVRVARMLAHRLTGR